MEKKGRPLLSLKIKYNVLFNFLYNHVTTLLIILLIVGVLIAENQLVGYGIAILVVYLVYLIISVLYNKAKYRNSMYNFYNDRLEYNNKINDDLQTVKYVNMTQIKYGQTFLQALFKIGNIVIYTDDKKITKKLIIIHDIKNVKMIYEKILKIMGEKTTDNK